MGVKNQKNSSLEQNPSREEEFISSTLPFGKECFFLPRKESFHGGRSRSSSSSRLSSPQAQWAVKPARASGWAGAVRHYRRRSRQEAVAAPPRQFLRDRSCAAPHRRT